jgi:hypothetical protein
MASPLRGRTAFGTALALSVGLYQLSATGVTRSQTPVPPALRDLSTIAQLQTAFDEDREKVRVLLLLSPT